MGILQTLMIPIRSATPFARAMQYSTARCLPLYAKGMLWFYDRDSVYWGHNALIRVAPFREHCRLPALPGKPPLGGTIMSQDIVEAAFLGRAGWEVGWLIDGGGSFDELPANILTYGQRDRRWCQGNFQHYRFILAPGIRFGHRFYFANGIFSYLASPLLLLLILLGLTQACLGAIPTPDPWLLWASMGLFWFQMLAPRVLGLIHFAGHCKPSAVKGRPQSVRWLSREAASTLAELVVNLLMGPLLFYLHTRFVVEILSGGHVVWRNQSRNPGERVLGQRRPSVLVAHDLGAAWPCRNPPRRLPAGAFYSPGDRLLVTLHSVGSAYFGCGARFMAAQGGILPRCPDRGRTGTPWPARERPAGLEAANRGEDAVQEGVGIGRATGNIDIYRDDFVHAAEAGVVLAEDAAAAATGAHGHYQSRRGRGVVGLAQSQFHVARDRAGDQQHVGMTGRGDEMNAEALDVIHRAVQSRDFDLAAVARAGIHFADVERAAQHLGDAGLQFGTEGLEGES